MPIKFTFTRKGSKAPDELLLVEQTLNKALQTNPMGYPIGQEDDFRNFPIVDQIADSLIMYMMEFPGTSTVTKIDPHVFQKKLAKMHVDNENACFLEHAVTRVLEIYDFKAWFQAHS